MIKICPRCRRTYSGGTACLSCPQEVALLDVAVPAVRRAHLRGDGELRVTLRTYYGARTAMLLLFWGILFGLALAVALARKAFNLGGAEGALLGGAAVLAAIGLPAGLAFAGAKLVHRFSRACRAKPLQASELRVVRRAERVG